MFLVKLCDENSTADLKKYEMQLALNKSSEECGRFSHQNNLKD